MREQNQNPPLTCSLHSLEFMERMRGANMDAIHREPCVLDKLVYETMSRTLVRTVG